MKIILRIYHVSIVLMLCWSAKPSERLSQHRYCSCLQKRQANWPQDLDGQTRLVELYVVNSYQQVRLGLIGETLSHISHCVAFRLMLFLLCFETDRKSTVGAKISNCYYQDSAIDDCR